jgi:hypothetical protein
MTVTLEELLEKGQVEAALLWDESLGLTKREQQLVMQAFAKGLEIGKQLAEVTS